eukprot:CAMPEP_0201949034 /NCGR_PEP_ID=MMETSP0903-20130614/55767_1 /ASSEMBLY_ACC=CAM_ASM_000552 /TAXON_ID=420261 /ORGANISM="Thalassiosira antarctica, Strain CCMP982" /LENGTH=449 /DNA_ID=CAMNT_0048492231 /DNA_START=27 /DNA_END=1378 /DNA_ORIENTATION=-
MKVSTALGPLLLLASSQVAEAFAPTSSQRINNVKSTRNVRLLATGSQLHMSSPSDDNGGAPIKKKVLTAADVMAKAAGAGDPNNAEDAPELFPPETYDDFQSTLLLLEKRARDGPGSLTTAEVSQFERETDRIVKEMKEFIMDPKGVGQRIRLGYEGARPSTPAPAVAAAVAQSSEVVMDAAVVKGPNYASAAASAAAAKASPTTPPTFIPFDGESDTDEPSDESMGFGLARGTTNTYAIDGMDEMSPLEYQAKLQETISARQAQRREDMLNADLDAIGNRSSSGYLDGLSGGGGAMYKKVDRLTSKEKAFKLSTAIGPLLLASSQVAEAFAPPSAVPLLNNVKSTRCGRLLSAGSQLHMSDNGGPSEEESSEESLGFGLAKGTTNTYIIDGMDEMTPEEYQAKLQETVSARQAKRRAASLNDDERLIGNRASTGYLDGLSGTGGAMYK